MTNYADRFLRPKSGRQRRYEALRARYVDGVSTAEAAERFGFAHGTLRNLCSAFRRSDDPQLFFWPEPKPRAPQPSDDPDPAELRRERILELRTGRRLSIHDIAEVLRTEGMPASPAHIHSVIAAAGLPPLKRRPAAERLEAARPETAAVADHRELDLSPRSLHTDFGGLFLFAHDIAALDLDGILGASAMPGSAMIPAGCAVRTLLGLKLWGVE